MSRYRNAALAAALALAGCQNFSDLAADAYLSPSATPVTVDSVRSGRLARVGAAQHPKILAMYGGEYSDPQLERMVAGIVGRLVTVSDNPSQVYQVSILDTPVVNAFALPGGYLYVSRGLLALANDSAELAAVIAHEMAHVTANHGVLRQQREQQAEQASRVVADVLSDQAAGQRALVRGKIALAQFSRNQELEADAIGIAAMAEAGFDPYAAAGFQKTMASYSALQNQAGYGEAGLDFLSSHPSTPQRVALALAHARKYGAPADGDREREAYLAGLDGLLFGDAETEGYVRGNVYAHPGLGIRLEFPEGFSISNEPDAVLASRNVDGAAIRFDGADVPASQSLTDYLRSGWVEGLDAGSVVPLEVNGLEAARASASAGSWAFDVTVVRARGDVYRILTAVPVGMRRAAMVAAPVRESFRMMSDAEKAALKPLRVRTAIAGPNDTIETMAARMQGLPNPETYFMTLNGLVPTSVLKPGYRYKIVTEG